MTVASAETNFYAMVDAVLKVKWLTVVSQEIGFTAMEGGGVFLGSDRSAAKSFVSRRGLGEMRHIEIRDLWLQREVMKGLVKIEKIPGDDNRADLMTKFVNAETIDRRLKEMSLEKMHGNAVKKKPQESNVARLPPHVWDGEAC